MKIQDKNKTALSIFFLICSIFCFSQKQNYVWHFGATGAGIDFENCTPTILTNGINNNIPFEGQSSISNGITGKLLFYTDGYNIYDSTNNIMQNGAGAGLSNSCTQTIIVKKPGSQTLFYMFTTDIQGGKVQNNNFPNAFGINWAEIDMSLNGGVGSVVSIFNPLKDTSNCEKLTAVYHSNGQDIWLIGHEYGNNNFFAFLITNLGISPSPIISSVGPIIYTWQNGTPGTSNLDAIGELKASPNGNKLAFTTFYNGITGLFDFNKSTGIISNPITLAIESGGYGVSFAPNSSILYVTGVDTTIPSYAKNGKLYQFDISSNSQSTIQNSRATVYTEPNGGFRSLKLGTNGKLYVAKIDTTTSGDFYLGIVNDPNNIGTTCNYAHNGLYLNGLRGRWGLNNAIEDSIICLYDGIIDIQNDNFLSIYPNPTQQFFHIKLPNKQNVDLLVFDINGRKIYERKNATGTIKVDCSSFNTGIYFVQATNEKNILTYKFIKE